MPSNTFGGVAVFGLAVKTTSNIAPRAIQVQSYAGVTGRESLDLGGRGRTTTVTGWIAGVNLADFVAAKSLVESYNDGVPRTYYDSAGVGWQNVLMGPPQFEGRIRPTGAGGFWQPYAVVLEHLSQV